MEYDLSTKPSAWDSKWLQPVIFAMALSAAAAFMAICLVAWAYERMLSAGAWLKERFLLALLLLLEDGEEHR